MKEIGEQRPDGGQTAGNAPVSGTIFVLSCLLLSVLQLTVPLSRAQQPENIPRVAYFSLRTASSLSHNLDAFRQALRELGYVEGKNILLEYRFADGKRDRMAALAAELVSLKVNVIVTGGGGATRPAKEATNTIPIVMAQDTDPLGNGFVASLARPGGNITGLSTLQVDLTGKRLELLKEVVPKLSRVAVIGSSTSADNTRELKETALAAAALGLKTQHFDIGAPKDIESRLHAALQARPDALFVLINSFERPQNKQIVAFAAKSRLPAMYFSPTLVEDGGLMSYSVNGADLYRRAAVYVDKILRGAKPAELPVEQPTKLELVINLKTAKQIGITIPPHVLARADRVIR